MSGYMDIDNPTLTALDEIESKYGEGAYITARYFTSLPQFEYIKSVGDPGAQGGAFLYHEKDGEGAFLRQLIVKYYDDPADLDAETELAFLTMLSGAEHIIQLIGDGQASIEPYGIALLLEYVGHGDLSNLIHRVKGGDVQIPNRLLWSFFLCLVQACIAMGYPPGAPVDASVQTETIPSSPPTDTICHGDMHCGNILVAANYNTNPAHRLGPILKLIDFGLGTLLQNDTAGEGIKRNIYDIGAVMSKLVLRNECIVTIMSADIEYTSITDAPTVKVNMSAGPAGPRTTIATLAPTDLDAAPITEDMRDLIYRCMAHDKDQRPTLQQALDICQDAVLNKTEGDFGELGDDRQSLETDEAVKRIVNEMVMNAEVRAEDERLRLVRRASPALLDPAVAASIAGRKRKKSNTSSAGSGGRNVRPRL